MCDVVYYAGVGNFDQNYYQVKDVEILKNYFAKIQNLAIIAGQSENDKLQYQIPGYMKISINKIANVESNKNNFVIIKFNFFEFLTNEETKKI